MRLFLIRFGYYNPLSAIADSRRRLGGGRDDANELKRHPFFRGLNWDDLAARRVPAPFVPKISNELDVSNFAEGAVTRALIMLGHSRLFINRIHVHGSKH